jgi:hypothetical protein
MIIIDTTGFLTPTTEICIELTFHSPPPTPLLRALTLSAGEHKVSRGESRVSRQVGLPHNLRAPRSKPKNGLPLFLAALSRLLSCRHGGATGVIGIGQMLLGKTPPFPGTAEPVPGNIHRFRYHRRPLDQSYTGGPFWAPGQRGQISHSGASILHFYHIDEDGTIRELASRKRDVTLLVR